MVLRLYVDAAPNMSQLYGTAAGVVAGMLAAYAGAFVVLVSALAARPVQCALPERTGH